MTAPPVGPGCPSDTAHPHGRWGDEIPPGTLSLSRLTLAERERIRQAVYGEAASVTVLYEQLIGIDTALRGYEVERGYPPRSEAEAIRREAGIDRH